MKKATDYLAEQIVAARIRLGEVVLAEEVEGLKKLDPMRITVEAQLLRETLTLNMTVAQFDIMYETFARERRRVERMEEYEDNDI